MTFIIMILLFGGAYAMFGVFCIFIKALEIILDPRKILMVLVGALFILLLVILDWLNLSIFWSIPIVVGCCYYYVYWSVFKK